MAPLKIQILDARYSEWGMPCRAKPGDAGIDLRCCVRERAFMTPGNVMSIPTGIAAAIPEGYAGLLMPRSGGLTLADGVKGYAHLANTIGLIDSGYRGEIIAKFKNTNTVPLWINPGERFLQLVVVAAPAMDLEFVDALDQTERGAGGFGHTGAR